MSQPLEFEDFDIYVLVDEASIASIKKFTDKWTIGLHQPTEYIVHLSSDSYLEFGDIESALNHFLRENVSASLFWFEIPGSHAKVDSVFLFSNEDNSVIFGIGKRLWDISEALPYLKELAEDLKVVAGYATVGVPADSRQIFLSVAQQSEPPKVLDGVVIEN